MLPQDGKATPEYQKVVSSSTLNTWSQDVSTTIGQLVDCEVGGYYVTTDDECHERLRPKNITCAGTVLVFLVMQ